MKKNKYKLFRMVILPFLVVMLFYPGCESEKGLSEKQLKIKKSGEVIGNISISLGISQINGRDTIDSVIERADEALYAAKKAGGDKVKSENDLVAKKIQNL